MYATMLASKPLLLGLREKQREAPGCSLNEGGCPQPCACRGRPWQEGRLAQALSQGPSQLSVPQSSRNVQLAGSTHRSLC